MRKIITTAICIFFSSCIFGQISIQELAERIGTEKKFDRIQQIAATYFKEAKARVKAGVGTRANVGVEEAEENEFEKAELFYYRWAWYNSARLDADGNVTDYTTRNLQAMANEPAPDALARNNNSLWIAQGPTFYSVPNLTFSNGANRRVIDGLGRVDCIAFHPTDASTMYAGTPMGGLWKTTNGGAAWSQVAGLFPFLGIAGVVVNKNNGNEIWALAGTRANKNTWGIFALESGSRVYHSIDGGQNWSPTGAFPFASNSGFGGWDLIQHPSQAQTIFAATLNGVYISNNGGISWDTTALRLVVQDIEINPQTERLIASGPGFVKYSDDEGATWNDCSFNVSITGMNRASITISRAGTGNTVYLFCGPAGDSTFYGLYKSTNGGTTFTRQSNAPNAFGFSTDGSDNFDQSNYDNCIVAHPSDASRILTGGAAIWQSNNDGITMTFNTYYWNNGPPDRYVHPDIHALRINPLNNNLYACTDGGVYLSTDFGATWVQRTIGLSAAQIFHMSTYKNNDMMELYGSQDNGLKIRTNNGIYQQFEGADGYSVEFGLNDSSIIYGCVNSAFLKYDNFGQRNLAVAYPFLQGGDEKFYMMVKVTPSATNTEILFAAAMDTLSRSTDGGASWTRVVRRANWDIKSAPSNPAYVYVAGGSNSFAASGFSLARSSNYGNGSWTNITGTFALAGQRAMKFAIDPFDHLHIYVCIGGYVGGQKVYKSINGGDNWSNVSFNLPNVPVNSIAMDNAGHLYAGTDIGVFVLPSGQTQWRPFYNRLPRVPVTELIVNNEAGTIKAATFGCGVYKADLYGFCPPLYDIFTNYTGKRTVEASDRINGIPFTTSGGYELTDVRLKAGNLIVFSPGTDMKNATVIAGIGPCGVAFPGRVVPIQTPVQQIGNDTLLKGMQMQANMNAAEQNNTNSNGADKKSKPQPPKKELFKNEEE
jgi:hypothetical protein